MDDNQRHPPLRSPLALSADPGMMVEETPEALGGSSEVVPPRFDTIGLDGAVWKVSGRRVGSGYGDGPVFVYVSAHVKLSTLVLLLRPTGDAAHFKWNAAPRELPLAQRGVMPSQRHPHSDLVVHSGCACSQHVWPADLFCGRRVFLWWRAGVVFLHTWADEGGGARKDACRSQA